ncbi:DinB family protein [Paenibacillus sp. NEAU-GSW1]|uniref:DinB family protein n=1 Tax=Paenibacillus sp. NEAU-GSW1 TaxID=2682486 RepID=UPI0012E1E342|nr:DinB family protein [Paenibacillus sp. NEAU-GSW1]MUT65638.1 hypothetical protein [Paenibacillus sp. NEAU-GSW1]
MYQTINSFIEDYSRELTTTAKVLEALTDASLAQEVAPGFRTLGFLAWHVALSAGMLRETGLKFQGPPSERPDSAPAIVQAYRSTAQSVMDAVKAELTDEKMQESVTALGRPWTYGSLLAMYVKHEIHHRGQLTILMRQAGLAVPGVYGPSKEEWAQMGMNAPQ